jgi:hypothetical protein
LSLQATGDRPDLVKTMKIKEDTHKRLTEYAKWGETLDTVINRVLDELEECKNAKGKK